MKILLTLIAVIFSVSNLYAEKLVIGASSFNPPMEMQVTKTNVFTGFEIDLLNEVCRRIEASCSFKPMTFEGILQATLNNEIDLGIDGFFITQERLKSFLFSEPYLQAKAQMFTTTHSSVNPESINTGKRIGVEKGTVFKSLLEQKYNNVNIIEYNTQTDMLQDLANRKIDLIMFDLIGASYWVNTNPNYFKLIGEATPFDMGYGIVANINQQQLIARINKALNDMQNDGTYLAIYSRYFNDKLN